MHADSAFATSWLRRGLALLAAFGAVLLITWWVGGATHRLPEPAPTVRSAASREGGPPLPARLRQPRIVIIKSARRLLLYDGDRQLRAYRIGLGRSPRGGKQREGDGRTPEGEYYICHKNPRSRFYLSLAISYPNQRDAQRARDHGLISQAQYARITRALRKKETPPWNTPLGGEIFVHGNGSQRDWTLGCIALDDSDMRELYYAVPVKTPVTILPRPLARQGAP